MGKQKDFRQVHHLSHKKKDKRKDKTWKPSRLNCHENFFKTVEEAVQAELTATANSKKICRKELKELERYPTLFKAVFLGCERALDNILEAGENVNAQISDGSTPLMIAVENGYPSIVQKLLKKGADPRLIRQDGRNALMIAVAKNDIRSFTLIWNYWDKSNFLELNHSDSKGFTALIIATEHSNSQFTTFLLNLNGIEIDKQTNEGRTALMYAVSAGQTDVVQNLIASGSDIVLEDKNGATAICLAIAQNKEDIKDILIEGLDSKAKDTYIKKRVELLSEPRTEESVVLSTFYKDILFHVILEIRKSFDNGIELLHKYQVFVSLLKCLETSQQNTELLRIGFHLSVCLMYDKAECSRYIVEELAEQYMSNKGADFSLKIMNIYRLKCMCDLRSAAFLTIHAGTQCQSGKLWLKANYFQVLPFIKEFRLVFPSLSFWVDGEDVNAKIMFDRFMDALLCIEKELTVASDLKVKKDEGPIAVQENTKIVTSANRTSVASEDQQWCLVSNSKSSSSKSSRKKTNNQLLISSRPKKGGKKKNKGSKLQTKLHEKIALKKLSQQPNVKSIPDFCRSFPSFVPEIKSLRTGYADALKKNLSEDSEDLNEYRILDSKKIDARSLFQENEDHFSSMKPEKGSNRNGSGQDLCDKNRLNNSAKLMTSGMNMLDLDIRKNASAGQKEIAELSYRDVLKSTAGNLKKLQQQKSVLHDILVSIGFKNNVKENISSDQREDTEHIEQKQLLNDNPNNRKLKEGDAEKKIFLNESRSVTKDKCAKAILHSEHSISFASVLKKWFTSTVKKTGNAEEMRLQELDTFSKVAAPDALKEILKEEQQMNGSNYVQGNHINDSSGYPTFYDIAKAESSEIEKENYKCEKVVKSDSGKIERGNTERFDAAVKKKESLEKQYEHKVEKNILRTQKTFKDLIQTRNSTAQMNDNESCEVDPKQIPIEESNSFILSNDIGESNDFVKSNKRKYEESESQDLSYSFYNEEIKETEFSTPLFLRSFGISNTVQKIEKEYSDVGNNNCKLREGEAEAKILNYDTEAYTKSHKATENSKSSLKDGVLDFKAIQTAAKSNLSNSHKCIRIYQHLVFHKTICRLRMSIFNESYFSQNPASNLVSSKESATKCTNAKNSSDLFHSKSITKCSHCPSVMKDYSSLTRIECSQFLKATLLHSMEDEHARFLVKHGIRAAKISERNENSKLMKSYDQIDENHTRDIFGNSFYGFKPQFINCQYSSRWYKVLQKIDTCVPLREFFFGFSQLNRSFPTDHTMHELTSSSGKIVFSSKEEHVLGDGKIKTNLGLMANGNPVVVRRLWNSTSNGIKFLMQKRRLNHRNIATFYCVCSSRVDKELFAVTELIEYSLPEYMKLVNYDGKFLVQELVEAVRYLHGKRIVHGFLKPTNIMITLEHRLKVTGFYQLDVEPLQYGLKSKKKDAPAPIGRPTLSSFCWRPYECIAASSVDEARKYTTPASDIQMTGMLMYYILSNGKHPFGCSDLKCQENIRDGFPELGARPSDVESRDLIRNMILRIPLSRPKINTVAKHPYLWNIERRFQFLVTVSRKIDFLTQKPTKFAENLNYSCIEGRNWTSYIDREILKYISKEMNKTYADNYADMFNFIVAINDHFEIMPQEIKVSVYQPSLFIFTALPTIFMSVYCVVRDNACFQRQMAVQDYF